MDGWFFHTLSILAHLATCAVLTGTLSCKKSRYFFHQFASLVFRGGFFSFSIQCIDWFWLQNLLSNSCFINSDKTRKNIVKIITIDVEKLLRSCDSTLFIQWREHLRRPTRAHLIHVQMIVPNVTDSFFNDDHSFSYLPQFDLAIFETSFSLFQYFLWW